MNYNFDEIIDRRGTGSVRWDSVVAKFGSPDVIPLTTADMDYRIAKPIQDAIKDAAEFGVFGYTKARPSYYDAVEKRFAERWKWTVERDWISYSSGIVGGIAYCIQGMTQPGDGIALITPIYHPFSHLIEDNGRTVCYSALQQDGDTITIDFDQLAQVLSEENTKMLIFCNPHNPVGRAWNETELAQVCKLCVAHGVILLADEIHSDFVFSGYQFTSAAPLMQAVGGLEQLIVCSSAAKSFNIAGLQCSSIVIPSDALRAKYRRILMNQHLMEMNAIGPVATEAAYEHGQEWLDQVMSYLEGNRDYMLDYIKTNIPKIHAIKPEATYMMWVDFRNLGMTEGALNTFLVEKAKLGLSMGSTFGPGGEGYIRINFAIPRSLLTQALEQLRSAVDSLS